MVFNWFISWQYMGTVLAVVYAADTIVAYKFYRDSGDWLSCVHILQPAHSLSPEKKTIMMV